MMITAGMGKRSWKMFFCRLKELMLVLTPDETAKVPTSNAFQIKLHHSFAAVASDYRKRRNVFRLILADRSQFLFQSSDTREMHSWIDMLNWNAARFSAPALDAPCGSSGRFEKPLLPSCVTRMTKREQATTHQGALSNYEKEMDILVRIVQLHKENLCSSGDLLN
jgi:PH/SEC7 domain-containing protein